MSLEYGSATLEIDIYVKLRLTISMVGTGNETVRGQHHTNIFLQDLLFEQDRTLCVNLRGRWSTVLHGILADRY